MNTNESINHAAQIAQFKFGLIAPVIQDLFPGPSRVAFYKRITENPIEFPDGSVRKLNYKTLEKWVCNYQKYGIDALMPPPRPSENLDFLWPDNQFWHKICPFFMHIES